MESLLHRHPLIADLAATAVALVAAFASVFYVAELVGWPIALLLHVPPPLAVLARRWAPGSALGLTVTLSLVQWALAVPYGGAQVSVLITLYTVARLRSLAVARAGLAAGLVLAAIGPLRQPYWDPVSAIFGGLLVVLVHVLGTNVELRAQYLRELLARAEGLERERDTAVAAAAADERARIARELHDVVAHHVSVMVVQAEGARWAMDSDPAAARTAVATISTTGRTALAELRRLLGVLRTSGPNERVPQPGLGDLRELAEHFRSSGLTVSLDLDAGHTELPKTLQLAAFRVVQESLTNVLKHAGPGASAAIRLTRGPHGLTVEATDDGGAVTRQPEPEPQPVPVPVPEQAADGGPRGPGHGLIGIRERAALFGGQAECGRQAGGGFRVRVELPC